MDLKDPDLIGIGNPKTEPAGWTPSKTIVMVIEDGDWRIKRLDSSPPVLWIKKYLRDDASSIK